MESYSVFRWLSLLRRCSISNNAEDMECPGVDFTFSGSRKGNHNVYLPLSSLVVVRRKFSSQVTSDDFSTFTLAFQNVASILSRDVSNMWETRVEKAEIWFCLGAGIGLVRIHPKMIYWPRYRVPLRSTDGSTSAPIKIYICALS